MVARLQFGGGRLRRVPAAKRDALRACSAGKLTLIVLGAGLMAAAAAAAAGASSFGPMSRHMLGHVLVMNLLAPIAVLGVRAATARPSISPGGRSGARLVAAAAAQLALLWGWHAPPAYALAHESAAMSVLTGAALATAAIWFWNEVFAQIGAGRWRAIVALLLSGKLFCLLGAILVFSPRVLYPGHAASSGALADQQLAGLLMLAACPLTYTVVGVALAALWLRELAAADALDQRPG